MCPYVCVLALKVLLLALMSLSVVLSLAVVALSDSACLTSDLHSVAVWLLSA